MKRNSFHDAFLILLAVSLIRGVSGPGINASSGLFLTPVATDFGLGIGTLSLYLSVSSLVTLLFLPFAGRLWKRFSVKPLVCAGVLLQILAFIALGFVPSVWGFYLLAVPLALGSTLLVNLLGPVMIQRWFVQKIGLVMGLMMMLTSLTGVFLQPLLTHLIAAQGWRRSYVIFGIFALLFLLLLGLLLLKNSPKEAGVLPYGAQTRDLEGKTELVQKSSVHAAQALKSPAFFALLFFMVVLTGFAAFHQHITTFGLGLGLELRGIGTALSLSMLGSALGALLIGLCSDKLGAVPTSLGVLGLGFMAIVLFHFAGGNFILFATATFLHGLATAAIGVIAPLLTVQFFGPRDYEKLLSSVMVGSPLASIILLPGYGFLYDRFGNYQLVFLFLLFMLALAAIALFFGARSSKKLLRTGE